MWIDRHPSGEPSGLFAVRQYAVQEEISEEHKDVVWFLSRSMIWDTGTYRSKTAQEIDAEKAAIATDALKLVASCILEAVFDMKANPANYPTAASLKQKALELYKARL